MWCGGTRETREPHATIRRTVSKSETTKTLPAFQDLYRIEQYKNTLLSAPLHECRTMNLGYEF